MTSQLRYIVACDHPGCHRVELLERMFTRGWTETGWTETQYGHYCFDHRGDRDDQ
jgi:hypothetical protein